MRVPLFNLFEAGRYSLAPKFYPRLRSLRSLSLVLLRIKPVGALHWQKKKYQRGGRMGIFPMSEFANALIVNVLQSSPHAEDRGLFSVYQEVGLDDA